MPAPTTTTSTNTVSTERLHPGCVVCDPANPHGLNLCCQPDGEASVSAVFRPESWMSGYPSQLHGGLVCTLLDGAMTQCLFAHDIQAVTAVMHTRFRRAVPMDRALTVSARIEHSDRRRYRVRSKLHAGDLLLAEAEAMFVTPPAGV